MPPLGSRKSPSASVNPVSASATFPNIFLPNSLLFPQEHGNPGRNFNDQELGELIADNKVVLTYAVSFLTWERLTPELPALQVSLALPLAQPARIPAKVPSRSSDAGRW